MISYAQNRELRRRVDHTVMRVPLHEQYAHKPYIQALRRFFKYSDLLLHLVKGEQNSDGEQYDFNHILLFRMKRLKCDKLQDRLFFEALDHVCLESGSALPQPIVALITEYMFECKWTYVVIEEDVGSLPSTERCNEPLEWLAERIERAWLPETQYDAWKYMRSRGLGHDSLRNTVSCPVSLSDSLIDVAAQFNIPITDLWRQDADMPWWLKMLPHELSHGKKDLSFARCSTMTTTTTRR